MGGIAISQIILWLPALNDPCKFFVGDDLPDITDNEALSQLEFDENCTPMRFGDRTRLDVWLDIIIGHGASLFAILLALVGVVKSHLRLLVLAGLIMTALSLPSIVAFFNPMINTLGAGLFFLAARAMQPGSMRTAIRVVGFGAVLMMIFSIKSLVIQAITYPEGFAIDSPVVLFYGFGIFSMAAIAYFSLRPYEILEIENASEEEVAEDESTDEEE